MQKQRQKLQDTVLVVRLVPYHVKGRIEHLSVDWYSFWGNETVVVSLTTVRKRNGRWKAVELEMPEDISEIDIEDILSCCWYIFDKKSNRKCPPIIQAWEFTTPPVHVVACIPHQKYCLFKSQLKEMESDNLSDTNAYDNNLIHTLRSLRPGICTVASDAGILEFDITETGIFSERSYCPICKGDCGNEIDKEIIANLSVLLTQGQAGITVRTFTGETVSIKGENGSINRVPVKEIRGFIAAYAFEGDGLPQLIWEKVSSEELKQMFSISSDTGKYIGLTVNKKDHRFI